MDRFLRREVRRKRLAVSPRIHASAASIACLGLDRACLLEPEAVGDEPVDDVPLLRPWLLAKGDPMVSSSRNSLSFAASNGGSTDASTKGECVAAMSWTEAPAGRHVSQP